jgi:hypothetical protein
MRRQRGEFFLLLDDERRHADDDADDDDDDDADADDHAQAQVQAGLLSRRRSRRPAERTFAGLVGGEFTLTARSRGARRRS